jgi:molecular chaperone GrpE
MAKRKNSENSHVSSDSASSASGANSAAAVDELTEDGEAARAGATQELPAPDLELELQEARQEAAAHLDDFLRARAELDNLSKRAVRDLENARKFGLERFMTELLPVKDSVELGLNAADDAAADPIKLREGLELTLKLFNAASEKFGLQEVDPAGQHFDPEYHQAMSIREESGVEPGTVLTVVQKGYLLNDRLLRPAMVIVAQ